MPTQLLINSLELNHKTGTQVWKQCICYFDKLSSWLLKLIEESSETLCLKKKSLLSLFVSDVFLNRAREAHDRGKQIAFVQGKLCLWYQTIQS